MVEFYPYEDLGYVVDPESDMKEITVILIGKQMAIHVRLLFISQVEK